MVTVLQAAILGLIQGITELFSLSSVDHSALLPKLFGWNLEQSNPAFLGLLIATHWEMAIVLVVFFIKNWMNVFQGLGRYVHDRRIAPGDADLKVAEDQIDAERNDTVISRLSFRPGLGVGQAQAAARFSTRFLLRDFEALLVIAR
jgi:hypothetical protein